VNAQLAGGARASDVCATDAIFAKDWNRRADVAAGGSCWSNREDARRLLLAQRCSGAGRFAWNPLISLEPGHWPAKRPSLPPTIDFAVPMRLCCR